MTYATRALLATLALTLVGCEQLLTTPIPYGKVRVEVRSRGGAPIPGVRSVLYHSSGPRGYAVTDDSGRTTFVRVPKAQYGVVLTIPSGYAPVSSIIAGAAGERVDGLDIEPGADTTLRFTLARLGNGVVEAEVKDQDGIPVPGLSVSLYRTSVLDSARSDARGGVRFANVPFGNYGIFLTPPDSLGVQNAHTIYRDGLPVDAEVVARASIVVTRCFGSIRPRVLDQDGLAVPGIPVTLYRGFGNRATGATDDAGRVTFANMPCDNWGVFASEIPGYSLTWARGFAFQDGLFLTQRATLEPTLRATQCMGTIRPRVLDQDGRAVAGIPVTLWRGSGSRATSATDDAGRVTFANVPCENWGVFASGIPGYSLTSARGFAFQDGLFLTHRATLEPILRATRQ